MILNYTPRFINHVPLTFSLVYEKPPLFLNFVSAKYCSPPLCYVGLNLTYPLQNGSC